MSARVKRTLVRAGSVLLMVVMAVLVYGVAIEPRLVLDERRYRAKLPELGQQWAGTHIAVFSDLQVGMWWDNTAMVERVVDRVVDERPAAALVAGDFLYGDSPSISQQLNTVVRLLQTLRTAGIPTFAVLGNHDYAVGGADPLTAALRDAGVRVLHNGAARIPAPHGTTGEPLYVVGLAPTRPGLTDIDKALAALPADAARVVLMHNPTAFPRLPAGTAPLALAGHTHCGQVAVPGLPRWSYLGLTEEEEVVADGFAPTAYGQRGNVLFVTCGIGFSLVPVRIGAAPQLVFFELAVGD
ncbi:metallophosphoesterase [Georgenia sp. AZ-5]|uniref:metallophosphoesterase n=1 Tax=Georgenia sp. AZ-5 TaxID=3367526 RepID=UPI003754A789